MTALLVCQPPAAFAGESDAGIREYQVWLAKGSHRRQVSRFEAALKARELNGIVPTYQILRTALDWRKCHAEGFALPDPGTWNDAFASLSTLKRELVPLVGDVEIVSGYRDAALNTCAGGAKGSVHRKFGAFDVFARQIDRDSLIARLCRWHKRRGPALRAGLGIYSGTKFHIDVGIRGYRTWGPDYHRTSSPCAA